MNMNRDPEAVVKENNKFLSMLVEEHAEDSLYTRPITHRSNSPILTNGWRLT